MFEKANPKYKPRVFYDPAEILRLYTEDLLTMNAIGERYGLTRERIRQILAQQNIRFKDVQRIRTPVAVSAPKFKPTPIDKFWAKVDKAGKHWIWTGKSNNGYGRVRFRGEPTYPHIVAWTIIKKKRPEGILLNQCGNTMCVNPDCWAEGTYSDICKFRKAGANQKLTVEDKREIVIAIENKEKSSDIAQRFGITKGYVDQMRYGKTAITTK